MKEISPEEYYQDRRHTFTPTPLPPHQHSCQHVTISFHLPSLSHTKTEREKKISHSKKNPYYYHPSDAVPSTRVVISSTEPQHASMNNDWREHLLAHSYLLLPSRNPLHRPYSFVPTVQTKDERNPSMKGWMEAYPRWIIIRYQDW